MSALAHTLVLIELGWGTMVGASYQDVLGWTGIVRRTIPMTSIVQAYPVTWTLSRAPQKLQLACNERGASNVGIVLVWRPRLEHISGSSSEHGNWSITGL